VEAPHHYNVRRKADTAFYASLNVLAIEPECGWGPCEWLFKERGQKDLFLHYYQKALLDAYLMPFLSNL